MIKYFAYGSNMNEKRMEERDIRFSKKQKAILPGCQLVFNKIACYNNNQGYANIQLHPSDKVEGILYNIPNEDLQKLDIFEGFPTHYERWEVTLLVKEKLVNAITYIAHPSKTAKGLRPTRDYLNHLLAGKSFLSKEYYDKLENTSVYEDSYDGLFRY
jgi:gamma-glutamylcyclotransferase (GGCT)/AIG2-like uncharacterized protein YtfP